MDVEITDNSEEVLDALQRQIAAALEACGNQAVSHSKQIVTAASRIDTGALRNSINHRVTMDEKACYIGTNQDYAIYNEFGTGIYADGGGRQSPWSYKDDQGKWHRTRGMKPIHFLKDAIAKHTDEYKAIIKQYLKGG
jgi:hypothetical protein